MRRPEPRGLAERASGACFALLLGALALYVAVKLIAAVIVPLLLLAGVASIIAVITTYCRSRRNHW